MSVINFSDLKMGDKFVFTFRHNSDDFAERLMRDKSLLNMKIGANTYTNVEKGGVRVELGFGHFDDSTTSGVERVQVKHLVIKI